MRGTKKGSTLRGGSSRGVFYRVRGGGGWVSKTDPGDTLGASIRSGGVLSCCTITMFARLWRCQGGIKREPAAPGGPGGAQGVPQGVSGCSFSVSGFSFGVSERSSSCFSDLRTVPSRLQTNLPRHLIQLGTYHGYGVSFEGRRKPVWGSEPIVLDARMVHFGYELDGSWLASK